MKALRKRSTWILPILLLLLIGASAYRTVHDYRQRQRDDALIKAIGSGDTAAALLALKSGASPGARMTPAPPSSLGPFLLDRWRQLYRRKRPPASEGPTALTLAVEHNNPTIVEALLARGARDLGEKLQADDAIRSQRRDACTLLMYAARKNSPRIIRALVQHGSDVHARDASQSTALLYACGDEAIQALCEAGAEIDARNRTGTTPLYAAAALHLHTSVRLLLEHGADPNGRTAKGQTPLFAASATSTKLLLEYGADPNVSDDAGATPLFYAKEKEQVEALIARGARVDAADTRGMSLLIAAVCSKSPQMIEALLEQGADPNGKGRYGGFRTFGRIGTPIQEAAVWERQDLIPILLRHGAKINFRDSEGDTALTMAKHYRNASMVRLLNRYGAKE